MLSFNSMAAIGLVGTGVIGTGLAARRHVRNDEIMDRGDKAGFIASSTVAGVGVGLGLLGGAMALKSMGYKGLKAASGMASTAWKAATWTPLNDMTRKAGAPLASGLFGSRGIGPRYKFGMARALSGSGVRQGIPKGSRGPLGMLALTAASIGAIAYSARSNPQTNAYAERDEFGGTEYTQQPLKERLDMMHATGDMVFGMNNSRHGA